MEITLPQIDFQPPPPNQTPTKLPPNQTPIWTDDQQAMFLRIITFMEQTFWMEGEYPASNITCRKFGLTTLQFYKDKINNTLKLRGLPPYDYKSKLAEGELDAQFLVACNLICDTLDKRSRSMKLKAVNLTTQQFQVMLHNKDHLEYYKKRVDKSFKGVEESAKLSLSRNVEAGDLQSIKYYHEFTGIHDPNKEITTNLNKLISLFFEVLVRHVPVDVVDKIASEFDVQLLQLER